jgi:RimJ/RimL family protein N-acetyltransferase
MAHVGFTMLAAERLVLRRFRREDLPAFVAYRSDPEVARYQSWSAPYPMEEAERMFGELAGQHPDTPGEWFQFAVALHGSAELIGDCGVHVRADDPRQAEIGFTFAPAAHGHGYATEAVRRVLDYLFVERGKHRVTGACDDRNLRSAALLRRVGMRREGLAVESVWSKGEWTNDELYAVLEREWPGERAHRGLWRVSCSASVSWRAPAD